MFAAVDRTKAVAFSPSRVQDGVTQVVQCSVPAADAEGYHPQLAQSQKWKKGKSPYTRGRIAVLVPHQLPCAVGLETQCVAVHAAYADCRWEGEQHVLCLLCRPWW